MPNSHANERFRNLLRLMLEKSRADALPWQEKRNSGFIAIFPKETVTLDFVRPSTDPDYYQAALVQQGRPIIEITAWDEDPDWALLRDLFSEAERSALGWDQAIADAEQALRTGWSPPPPSPTSEITDDDLPF